MPFVSLTVVGFVEANLIVTCLGVNYSHKDKYSCILSMQFSSEFFVSWKEVSSDNR